MPALSLFTLVISTTLASASLVRRQLGDHLNDNGNVTWSIQVVPYEDNNVPSNCAEPCNAWKEATRKGTCAIPLPSNLPLAAQTSRLPDGSVLTTCPLWTMRGEDVCAGLDVQASCTLCTFPNLNVTRPSYVATYGGLVKDCQAKGFKLPESVPGIDMKNPLAGLKASDGEGTPWNQIYGTPPANTPAVAAAESPSSSIAAAASATASSSAARRWARPGVALSLTTLAAVSLM